ncbi:MAG: hypothetical protein ACRCY2_09005 [Bombilactobacillus sp.]
MKKSNNYYHSATSLIFIFLLLVICYFWRHKFLYLILAFILLIGIIWRLLVSPKKPKK